MNLLKEKIKAGKKVIGTHVSLVDPSICEILGMMGFDYVWIDMEHTCIDFQTLNQYHLWNVKARYRVPNAGSGKYWRKCVEKMANM